MATLDNLKIPSLLNLAPEQGLQLILDVRLRRQQVLQEPRTKFPREKKLPSADALNKLSEKQITDLYYALMAKQQKELL